MRLITLGYGLITNCFLGFLKYTGTGMGNYSHIMYITYHTQTNREDDYRNPLNYIIIYCLSPSK